jgi:alkylhydroperoxidase family enzyme
MQMMTLKTLAASGLAFSIASAALADDRTPGSTPVPVPVTREDMKQALENSKHHVPRLPLPPPTADEEAKAKAASKDRRGMGGIVNNGRMRNLYLFDYGSALGNNAAGGRGARQGLGQGQGGAGQDASYPFQTMLFWIVSRGNNCTYCMGHQEVKLASAGLSDDKIAALDGDWSEFSETERAAFTFAKKLTYEPNGMSDADIAALRKHYSEPEMVEILVSVASFNATNRWTGALRIPQEGHRVFLKPTSPSYAAVASRVAPVGEKTSGCVPPAPRKRPPLETRFEVEQTLGRARTRTPRLRLADESATRMAFEGVAGEDPPQWMRLLAISSRSAQGRVTSILAAETKGTLDPKTRAIITWVAARNDRAWYALGRARDRLKTLGFSDDKIFALDEASTIASEGDGEVIRFAKTLAVDPALIVDDDFTRLRKHFDDKKIAEIVHQVTQAAFFDRLTEAAGLRLEARPGP